jgi:hypothetical protein
LSLAPLGRLSFKLTPVLGYPRPANAGTYSTAELAELFSVGRSTVFSRIRRLRPIPVEPERPFALTDAARR